MNEQLDNWKNGYGVIKHSATTQQRIKDWLITQPYSDQVKALDLMMAADHICNMAMWLTVHMTYASRVYLDGRTLKAEDMKFQPEGHTGGALNMVPAYVGYMLANALSGKTRSWMMGQGHCVAAIDAVNILLGNVDVEQHDRYPICDAGLSQLCQDFYSYQHEAAEGRVNVPLGSHVNAYTAGGIIEGGYLGFADLQYMHMPLPEQSLVTFLSDGAFEEQRGSDWAARWWRGEDTGYVMPIMIVNGRRIDQRSTITQCGGIDWFRRHLQLNGFSPIDIDGRDPAAFAWAILTMESSLDSAFKDIQRGNAQYPVTLPYAIAETVKGFGFPGAGTNAAHNLPLIHNPSVNNEALQLFNAGIKALYVPESALMKSLSIMRNPALDRTLEKDHPLRCLQVNDVKFPSHFISNAQNTASPMMVIDSWFVDFLRLNSEYRVRVGNPDEMQSNRMNKTLEYLKHRVTSVENPQLESIVGNVITALNEEAVVSAALANKQGINLVVSYEAFAVKMLGAMRQEVIFARHIRQSHKNMSWLGVPIVLTSHTWENGKNEQSHQDPTLSEAWLGEMSDVAPVYFPFDASTAVAAMQQVYSRRCNISLIIASKSLTPVLLNPEQAKVAVEIGSAIISHDKNASIQFLAVGTYQLQSVLRCVEVLRKSGILCSVVAVIEPGKFRIARDADEQDYVLTDDQIQQFIPYVAKRIVVSHTRADVMTGVLRRLDTGHNNMKVLGYANQGGTLNIEGMLLANGISVEQLIAHAHKLLNGVI